MIKKILFLPVTLFLGVNIACTSTEAPNTNANKAVVVNTNATAAPEGLSGNQIPLSANTTPGIPDPKSVNANNNSKSAVGIPGIPDTTKIGKTPMPKNTPKIPGIPDEETLKKQMNTPVGREMMDRKPPESDPKSGNRPPVKPRTMPVP